MTINVGYLCTRYQIKCGLGNKIAFRWLTPSLERAAYRFIDLENESNRVANVLQGLGVHETDRVFIFMPKMPELYFSLLAILKLNALACVLFPNFGPEALIDRMGNAQPTCVITRKSLLNRVLDVLPDLPSIRFVLIVDIDQHQAPKILSYRKLVAEASMKFSVQPVTPDTPSMLHYTSGSTGKPKGVVHVHGGIRTQQQTFVEILGVEPDDIYWCTADPGWVTGVSYGVLAPWSMGVTQIHYAGGFDAERWMKILEREAITVWYTAPTALRMMRQEEDNFYSQFHLPKLRSIFSVGEPLNPEMIAWGEKIFNRTIYDTWFQTETGSIMIANRPGLPVKPGSMGKPVHGLDVKILADDGSPLPVGERGNLCLKPGWESMFVNYYNNPSVYASKFRHGYYFTGDTAYCDADGYYWFTGRSDDAIT